MIALAIGRRLLGKTTLVYSMAIKCPYRVILDPRKLIHAGGVRVRSGDALDRAFDLMADGTLVIGNGQIAPDGKGVPVNEILITPDQDVQAMFDAASQHVKQWSIEYEKAIDRRLMFVVDEARFFELMKSPAFEYLLRAAPPDLIYIAITGHQPKDIPTAIRAIADHWLLFRITQEHDLAVIKERCGEDVAKAVAALKPHEFVDWDDAIGTARAFREPKAWYVALSQDDRKPVEILPETGADNRLDRERLF